MTAIYLLLLQAAAGLGLIGVILAGRWLESQSWRHSLVAFRLRLPVGLTIDAVTNWLGTVGAVTHAPWHGVLPAPPVALELVSSARGIDHVLLLPDALRDAVLAGLRAALPGLRLDELPDYLTTRPRFRIAAEAGLSSLRRPLAVERAEVASHTLLALAQPLYGAEQIVVQWILTGGGIPRPVPSVTAGNSQSTTPWPLDDPVSADSEAIRAERLKQKEPLLRATLRLGIVAADQPRAYSLYGRIWPALRVMNAPGVGIVRRWLPAELVASRLSRLAHPLAAWPLILNARELSGLLGFPVGAVHLPGLHLGAARQLPAPISLPRRGAIIGLSNYPGSQQRPVALRPDDRLRHIWAVGPTGTGKSTLLANLITQDMQAGSGLAVVDARGDLVREVLARVPESRRDDLILLDPSQTDRPVVGFNVLDIARGERGRELAVDHVLHIFQDLYRSSWGPRTADILRASLLTLMLAKAPDGSAFTLVELPELLTNAQFRAFVIGQAAIQHHHAELRSFWRWYQGLSAAERGQVTGPVLNKLRAFVLKTPLRLLLGQSRGIDLNTIFTHNKILLVPLSKGNLGPETAQLAGSLVVASVWQLALGRVALAPNRRRPVWLYADEFQDTVRLPIDLADMLAQARGLGLGLVLAHQYLGQLPEAIKTAVLGTARTQLAFQLDYDDAATLSRSFAPLDRADLMGLDRYEVALRPCVDGRTVSPVTVTTLPLPPATGDAAALAAYARSRYGVNRAAVTAALQARITITAPGGTPGRSPHRATP